jgi:hypothetical protein
MRALVAPDAPPVRGVMIAPLRCCFPYLIVVGHSSVFFLRNGTTCPYASGTMLRVLYTENGDGVRDVDAIQTLEGGRERAHGLASGTSGSGC